jgi:hypothetical protein
MTNELPYLDLEVNGFPKVVSHRGPRTGYVAPPVDSPPKVAGVQQTKTQPMGGEVVVAKGGAA